MIAATQYQFGVFVGVVFGSGIAAALWASAAQYRRDHADRERARLDALARLHHGRRR